MTHSASLDKIEAVARAIELFADLKDVAARSDDALVAACALAELLEPNTIVGYTTIDGRRPVATFQTAVYPRLPSWCFLEILELARLTLLASSLKFMGALGYLNAVS